jgi:hypothetical protein
LLGRFNAVSLGSLLACLFNYGDIRGL